MLPKNIIFPFISIVCAFSAEYSWAGEISTSDAVHMLNRTSFGARAGDVERVKQIGIDAYLDEQLYPEKIAVSEQLKSELSSLPNVGRSLEEIQKEYTPSGEILPKDINPEDRKIFQKKQAELVSEVQQAKLLRAVYSNAQLQEVMVDFWYNHFNVVAKKGGLPFSTSLSIGAYERDAIRPHAFGKFRDLLMATAHHPAMLVYLDNWMNTDPQKGKEKSNFKGLNENYAREIMELHTMGVHGGYTQNDVTTLAMILTGWGLKNDGKRPVLSFAFDEKRHASGDKVLLGKTIKSGGEDEVENAINMLAAHPSTAKYISYKLAEYFVADAPPQSLVDKMAGKFTSTDGDIRSVLEVMFHSEEFWDKKYRGAKFKAPFRYVVSALRLSGANINDAKKLVGAVGAMSQPLYMCPTPDGYPSTKDNWMNSDALVRRMDFARMLGNNIGNVGVKQNSENNASQNMENANNEPPVSGVAYAKEMMIAYGSEAFSANTIGAVENEKNIKVRAAMVLSSPEFLYY